MYMPIGGENTMVCMLYDRELRWDEGIVFMTLLEI